MTQAVELLRSKGEALNSSPRTTEKGKRKKN
jgi:hypothetical protein